MKSVSKRQSAEAVRKRAVVGNMFFRRTWGHTHFLLPQPQLQKPLQFEQSHDLLANQLVQKDSVQLAQNATAKCSGVVVLWFSGCSLFPHRTRSFGSHQTTTASTNAKWQMPDARFYICAVLSKDVVELVHDGGGLWMQIGRGT